MIRQLRPAPLFCTFFSAETQWVHLPRILGKLVEKKDCTKNELEKLNWEEKSKLIQSDPVTCGRRPDYQINQFIQKFLLSMQSCTSGENIRLDSTELNISSRARLIFIR